MPFREELDRFFPSGDYLPKYPDSIKDKSYYALVRHAERADKVPGAPKVDQWADPPLSERGFEQGAFAGQYFKDVFELNGMEFDEVIIECSPFMRCLQTAS